MLKTKIILISAILAILSGCATPAAKQAMVIKPETASIDKQDQKGKFNVESVSGGKATNPMWTSQVSKENFEAALKESLALSGLSTADQYKIDANLQSLKQPLFGLTFDVVSTVNYRVYKPGYEKQFPITATGTASVSDAFWQSIV